MLIGYIRVKAGDDDVLRAQRRALQDVGCERMVEELTSGGRWDQPELGRMLDGLEPGDVVVVAQLGCLGWSLQDVVRLAACCMDLEGRCSGPNTVGGQAVRA